MPLARRWFTVLACGVVASACEVERPLLTVTFEATSTADSSEAGADEVLSYSAYAAYTSLTAYRESRRFEFEPGGEPPRFDLDLTAPGETMQLFVNGMGYTDVSPDQLVPITRAQSPRFEFSAAGPAELRLLLAYVGTLNRLASPMASPRAFHTMTTLPDGQLLIAGGTPRASAQPDPLDLFDDGSVSLQFGLRETSAELLENRLHHSAGLISTASGQSAVEGQVLVAGGDVGQRLSILPTTVDTLEGATREMPVPTIELSQATIKALSSVELVDPTSGSSTRRVSLPFPQSFAASLAYDDGGLLVCGGLWDLSNGAGALTVADGCNVVKSTGFTTFPYLSPGRVLHQLVKLEDDRLLVAGGLTGLPMLEEATTQLTDRAHLMVPGASSWQEIGPMNEPRAAHSAALVPNAYGQVLVTGGYGRVRASRQGPEFLVLLDTAEVFDPSKVSEGRNSRPFRLLEARLNHARAFHSTLILEDGSVLIIGGIGYDLDQALPVERYNLELERFEVVEGFTLEPLVGASYAQLRGGEVLIAGGERLSSAGSQPVDTLELFVTAE